MIIGVDPHKSSHTATAVDPSTNAAVASVRVDASLAGYRELMRWATQFPQRRWAVEGARGLGPSSRPVALGSRRGCVRCAKHGHGAGA